MRGVTGTRWLSGQYPSYAAVTTQFYGNISSLHTFRMTDGVIGITFTTIGSDARGWDVMHDSARACSRNHELPSGEMESTKYNGKRCSGMKRITNER